MLLWISMSCGGTKPLPCLAPRSLRQYADVPLLGLVGWMGNVNRPQWPQTGNKKEKMGRNTLWAIPISPARCPKALKPKPPSPRAQSPKSSPSQRSTIITIPGSRTSTTYPAPSLNPPRPLSSAPSRLVRNDAGHQLECNTGLPLATCGRPAITPGLVNGAVVASTAWHRTCCGALVPSSLAGRSWSCVARRAGRTGIGRGAVG